MKREAIANILNFMVEKEGHKIPKRWVDMLVREEEKKELIRTLETHPDGSQFVYEGSLYFQDNINITKLPNDLVVDGNVYLYNNPNIIELPKKLLVRGDLILNNTNIRNLPMQLTVTGYLNLGNCKKLTRLPDNLNIKGYLNLDGCTGLKELPNNLYIGGNLYIENTLIAKNYTDDEIRDIVKLPMDDGIIGRIIRE